ncbi:hypothetical protein GCM10011512_09240 [Tersicoccus solisilvae]|uniref:Uncharacterized protein n=1 Tax=Tersicoccus solisilvae TaxID=1882339 RepID=A0ABQ1NTR9_9MICC|nr:hypothetical protein [Tersicoccus solisilvae]GGC84540.1 hypothetical protein GCM10011512_09240 [Tersicoccus solisilvae]
MRAVLTLPTPGRTLTRDDAVEALRSTSWLPHQGPETEAWRRAQVERLRARLPDAVQQQLAVSECLFIQVDSVEGIVSLERDEVMLIRLFGTTESIEAIKHAVNTVAGALPRAFMQAFGGAATDLRLDDEVVIRPAGDERTLAKGVIATPRTLRFATYVVTERPRERSLLLWLVLLTMLTAAASLTPVPRMGRRPVGRGQGVRRTHRVGSGGGDPDDHHQPRLRVPRLAQRPHRGPVALRMTAPRPAPGPEPARLVGGGV